MYGVDIISMLNKAIDNNRKYGIEYYNEPEDEDSLDYYVNVIFTYNRNNIDETGKDELVTYSLKEHYTKNPSTNIIENKFLEPAKINSDNIHSFKVAGFKCSNVTYNEKSNTKEVLALGRVNQMEFIQIPTR